MLFALCLLLSSSPLTSLSPSLFFNFKRFYYDNVLYSRLFLTERLFFFNSPVTTYPRDFVTTIYPLHMTHEYWPVLFLYNLNLKIKTKELMEPLLSLDKSNYPVVTLFVDLCYPDSSSMQDGCSIYEL